MSKSEKKARGTHRHSLPQSLPRTQKHRKRRELSLVTASQLVTEAWTATLYTVRLCTVRRQGQRSTARMDRPERQQVKEQNTWQK